jgi:NACalpha-BTF3-like transcription factor
MLKSLNHRHGLEQVMKQMPVEEAEALEAHLRCALAVHQNLIYFLFNPKVQVHRLASKAFLKQA